MMKNQIKLAAMAVGVTFASSTGISEAGRPFGMFSTPSSRTTQNYSAGNRSHTQPQQPASATSYATSILQSPERMEKVYGPSILLSADQPSAKTAVSQP